METLFCTNPNFLKLLVVIGNIINIVKVVLPMIIIIKTMIDGIKAVISNGWDELKKMFYKFSMRLISAVMIFIVPTIVDLMMSIVNESITMIDAGYQSCAENINNIEFYEYLAQLEKERKEQERLDKEESAKAEVEEEKTIKDNSTGSDNNASATIIGQKYNFTNDQLRGIAIVCQKEQGSVIGSAAEATLMANRFELYGSNYGSGASGLYNYVANSGWWFNAQPRMQDTSSLKPEILAAVKEVLVLGKRNLALYVDEHDCIDCGSYGFDVIKIITDGKTITSQSELKKHSNYKKDNTIIFNRYFGEYTFYTFPTETGDPFGYTIYAKNRIDSLNGGK